MQRFYGREKTIKSRSLKSINLKESINVYFNRLQKSINYGFLDITFIEFLLFNDNVKRMPARAIMIKCLFTVMFLLLNHLRILDLLIFKCMNLLYWIIINCLIYYLIFIYLAGKTKNEHQRMKVELCTMHIADYHVKLTTCVKMRPMIEIQRFKFWHVQVPKKI